MTPAPQPPMNFLTVVAGALFLWLASDILECDFARPWCDVFKACALFVVFARGIMRFFPRTTLAIEFAAAALLSLAAFAVYRSLRPQGRLPDGDPRPVAFRLDYRALEAALIAVSALDFVLHARNPAWFAGAMKIAPLFLVFICFGVFTRTDRLMSDADRRRQREKFDRFWARVSGAVQYLMTGKIDGWKRGSED